MREKLVYATQRGPGHWRKNRKGGKNSNLGGREEARSREISRDGHCWRTWRNRITFEQETEGDAKPVKSGKEKENGKRGLCCKSVFPIEEGERIHIPEEVGA